jgi:peroxiredoxin
MPDFAPGAGQPMPTAVPGMSKAADITCPGCGSLNQPGAKLCARCRAALPVLHRGAPRRRPPYAWIIGGEAIGLLVLLGVAAMMLREYGAPAQPIPLVTAAQLGPPTPTPTTHVWATWTPTPATVTLSPTPARVKGTSTPLPTVTRTPKATLPRVGWQIGQLAPDFSLADLQGDQVRLGSLRGRVVVLIFWATWCPSCRGELPDLQSFYADYQRQGVIVLGINQREAIDLVRNFRDSQKLTFPVLLDQDGQVGNRYHVDSVPRTIFLDRSGVIRSVLYGQSTRQYFVALVGPLL